MGGGMVLSQEGTTSSFGKRFREVYSTALLLFCTVLIMAAIFTEQTNLSEVHPALAFVLLVLALIWLSMVEGSQASLVGLPPVNANLFKESHETTYKIMQIINKGDNLDRYLMGRQFLVLALVFVENLCGDPIEGAQVLGMPDAVLAVFLGSGIALFFMTSMFAKISAQVNASRCMLDYVNNWFAVFTLYVSMIIEVSGLLHVCYIVQMFFGWAAGSPIVSKDAPPTKVQRFLFWIRVLVSTAILGYAFAVTLYALFHGETTMWAGVPPSVSLVLFFVFMAIVGMLEGMQIAFFCRCENDGRGTCCTPMGEKDERRVVPRRWTKSTRFHGWTSNVRHNVLFHCGKGDNHQIRTGRTKHLWSI